MNDIQVTATEQSYLHVPCGRTGKRRSRGLRQTASDLRDVNREGECYKEREAKMATDQPQQERPGVIESVLRLVFCLCLGENTDTAEEEARQNKDSVAEKAKGHRNYTTQKAKETADPAAQKEKLVEHKDEHRDYAAKKAKETRNSAVEKTVEYKDYAAEKLRDYTAEKEIEGKDVTVCKLGGLTESAKDATRKAMDFLSGEREEVKEKAAETTEATREKLSETEEGNGSHREQEAETIFDILGFGTIKDTIRGKLARPEDNVEETRATCEHRGTGRKCLNKDTEKVIPPEETAPGAVASILKASNQMTSQTFNDVGRMDDEGVNRLEMECTPKLSKDL
ncbi:hypothetical protein SADUNF_Sadunf15G0053600 [Salix dunnii]|uniref:Uncharacterized protein n=1 Tax=Salix dunnii TaxID=1413687 RepID=A0A835JAQ9_9ROSI|nr:hypothetical protein SADUNF_Sadunf15G0053600 [Salix dunnii]